MTRIHESELILNPDGSIYHLNLQPGDVADDIIIVGDPDRVSLISQHFDSIEIKKQKRELVTHTGYVGKKRISVISTGMSTDNIDIVFNELDALVNIDFHERKIKSTLKKLNIVRIGTAGGLQKDIPLNSVIISEYGIGLDGLANFYRFDHANTTLALKNNFTAHFADEIHMENTYVAAGSSALMNKFKEIGRLGITVTCAGFYGPQGRVLRLPLGVPDLIEKLQSFAYQEHLITNFEMETAGIYALGKLLGHECCSLSSIVANRATQQFSTDPKKAMDNLITTVLERLSL